MRRTGVSRRSAGRTPEAVCANTGRRRLATTRLATTNVIFSHVDNLQAYAVTNVLLADGDRLTSGQLHRLADSSLQSGKPGLGRRVPSPARS